MNLSPYLLAIIIAWLVAQGAKYVVDGVKSRTFRNLRQLYLSGNMPSAHSATVTALVVIVGLLNGVNGPLFAISVLFAAVTMYDAVMVRRSSGEQGIAIQELIRLGKLKVTVPRAARGHTPLEVLIGAIVGAAIAIVVFFATK